MKNTLQKRKELYEALADLNEPHEFRSFLEDLCTPAEIETMADRLMVAKLLHQEMPYRAIYEKTGTSTATVTRVARAMSIGEGYRHVLSRQNKRTELKSKTPLKDQG